MLKLIDSHWIETEAPFESQILVRAEGSDKAFERKVITRGDGDKETMLNSSDVKHPLEEDRTWDCRLLARSPAYDNDYDSSPASSDAEYFRVGLARQGTSSDLKGLNTLNELHELSHTLRRRSLKRKTGSFFDCNPPAGAGEGTAAPAKAKHVIPARRPPPPRGRPPARGRGRGRTSFPGRGRGMGMGSR